MTLFLFLVWLQMSAQPLQLTEPITVVNGWSAGTGCVDEMTITIPSEDGSGGDVIGICRDNKWHRVPPKTPDNFQSPIELHRNFGKEFAEDAQRAADETDGKPPKKWGDSGNGGGKPGYACIPGDERKECAITFAESAVDVPAVQVDYVVHKKGEYFSCGQNLCGAEKDIIEQHPTCADKSRVLLTSEDGKKHCVKF